MYNWLNYQRLRRRAFPHRYHHNRRMTQEEIDALDAIGFDWQLSAEESPESQPKSPVSRSSTATTAVDGKQKRIVSDDVRPTTNARVENKSARHSPSPNDKKPAEKPKTGEELYVNYATIGKRLPMIVVKQ